MKVLFKLPFLALFALLPLLSGCEKAKAIVGNINEREANIILVLLESKGIPATKEISTTGTEMGGGGAVTYQIVVPESHTIEAISYLNQNGFPRVQGTNLLDLFAKQGLMTSDREELIRYQAGLAQQLTNTILMIDGVIDASVQLSFPPEATTLAETAEKKKITAAVYVKHQGVIDDPNTHLENKIKRLISGSITGLDINDVTVVSDRSRFTDITLGVLGEPMNAKPREYLSIWSIVMSKDSASRFRFLFFLITTLTILFGILAGWLLWKLYPTLRKKGGVKELLSPTPFVSRELPIGEEETREEG